MGKSFFGLYYEKSRISMMKCLHVLYFIFLNTNLRVSDEVSSFY